MCRPYFIVVTIISARGSKIIHKGKVGVEADISKVADNSEAAFNSAPSPILIT